MSSSSFVSSLLSSSFLFLFLFLLVVVEAAEKSNPSSSSSSSSFHAELPSLIGLFGGFSVSTGTLFFNSSSSSSSSTSSWRSNVLPYLPSPVPEAIAVLCPYSSSPSFLNDANEIPEGGAGFFGSVVVASSVDSPTGGYVGVYKLDLDALFNTSGPEAHMMSHNNDRNNSDDGTSALSATAGWVSLASLSPETSGAAGTCLNDGYTFLICGGLLTPSENTTESCSSLDTRSNDTIWISVASMGTARSYHAMVLFDGNAIALGGADLAANILLNTAEGYDQASDKWVSFPSFIDGRAFFSAAVVSGNIYISGGEDNTGSLLDTVEYFYVNSTGQGWVQLRTILPGGSRWHHASVSFQGMLVVLGGNRREVDVYDPSKGVWVNDNGGNIIIPKLPVIYSDYMGSGVVSF